MMLERIDGLTGQIDELSTKIEQVIAPFEHQVTQLDEVAGIGRVSAQELIAEIGVDMAVFRTSDHLVSWAKYCPQAKQLGREKQKRLDRQRQPVAGRRPRRDRHR